MPAPVWRSRETGWGFMIKKDRLGKWYVAMYYLAYLMFAFTIGYGIAGFMPLGGDPEWNVDSVICLITACVTVCLFMIWSISAEDGHRRAVSRVTAIHMVLLLILFSYRQVIAPAVFSGFGSDTEKAVMAIVLIAVIPVFASFIFCWYRIVVPKIRHTLYHAGGIADTDRTVVVVRRTFNFNPLFKLMISADGIQQRIGYRETAVFVVEGNCFRIRLRYGFAKRDIVISDADRVTMDVGYDPVSGELMVSFVGTDGPADPPKGYDGHAGTDDPFRYL